MADFATNNPGVAQLKENVSFVVRDANDNKKRIKYLDIGTILSGGQDFDINGKIDQKSISTNDTSNTDKKIEVNGYAGAKVAANGGTTATYQIPYASKDADKISWGNPGTFMDSSSFKVNNDGKVEISVGGANADDNKVMLAKLNGSDKTVVTSAKFDGKSVYVDSDNEIKTRVRDKKGIGVGDGEDAGLYVMINRGLYLDDSGNINVSDDILGLTNRVAEIESYTNRVVAIESYTNRVIALETYTNAIINVVGYTNVVIDATNRVTILESYTNSLSTVNAMSNTLYGVTGITNRVVTLSGYTNTVISATNTIQTLTTYTNTVVETATYTNRVIALEPITNTVIAATNDIAELKGRKYIADMVSITTNDTEKTEQDPKNHGKFQLVGFSAASKGSDKFKIPYVIPSAQGGNSLAWNSPIDFFDKNYFRTDATSGKVQMNVTATDDATTIVTASMLEGQTSVQSKTLDGGSLVAEGTVLKVKAKENQGIGIDSTKSTGGVYVKIGNGLAFGDEGEINVIDPVLNLTNRVNTLEAYTNRVIELESYTNRVVELEAYTNVVIEATNVVCSATNLIASVTNDLYMTGGITNRIFDLECYTNTIVSVSNTLNTATNLMYKVGGVTNTIERLVTYTNTVIGVTNILYGANGVTNKIVQVDNTTNFLYGVYGFTNMFTRVINMSNGFDNHSIWTNGDALVEIKGWESMPNPGPFGEGDETDNLADFLTNKTETVVAKENVRIVTRVAGSDDDPASVGYLEIGDIASLTDSGFSKFVSRQREDYESKTEEDPYIPATDEIEWETETNVTDIILKEDRLVDRNSIKVNDDRLLEVAGFGKAEKLRFPMKVELKGGTNTLAWVYPFDDASISTNELLTVPMDGSKFKAEIKGFKAALADTYPVKQLDDDNNGYVSWKRIIKPDGDATDIDPFMYTSIKTLADYESAGKVQEGAGTNVFTLAGFPSAETNTVPVKVKNANNNEYTLEWRDIGAMGGATTFIGTDGSRATATNTVTFAAMEDSDVRVSVTNTPTGVIIKFGVYWK